jgi:hypothetical protein
MLAPYVWAFQRPLDLATLQHAANYVIGTHDFTSFAASDPDLTDRIQATENVGAPRPALSVPKEPALSLSEDPDSRTWVLSPPKNSVISTEAEDSLTVRSEVERPPHFAHADTDASVATMSTEPPPTPTTNTRTIHHSTWHQQEDLYIYRVTGSGFLHHMVRNLVGTFVQTATGHIAIEDIPKILAARNRSAAGYTAPARGLFLVEVEY